MSDPLREPVTKEEAKQIIDESVSGFVVVVRPEMVPTLGYVNPEDLRISPEVESYQFGRLE